jgi:hypothetical protein
VPLGGILWGSCRPLVLLPKASLDRLALDIQLRKNICPAYSMEPSQVQAEPEVVVARDRSRGLATLATRPCEQILKRKR